MRLNVSGGACAGSFPRRRCGFCRRRNYCGHTTIIALAPSVVGDADRHFPDEEVANEGDKETASEVTLAVVESHVWKTCPQLATGSFGKIRKRFEIASAIFDIKITDDTSIYEHVRGKCCWISFGSGINS